jgi:FixJ family two-component response regulator
MSRLQQYDDWMTSAGESGGFAPLASRLKMHKVPMIAIVDDDELIRVGTSSLIRSLGWETCEFSSAQSFLDAGVVSRVNCVISDVQMPGLSGIELQEQLIANGQKLPIIFITGHGSPAVRKRALDNGAACVLPKPIDAATIIRCLNKVFDTNV